ncbi:MAG: DUF2283 domain-containing protein [Candidatus Parabeggiatoa sp. nov. 1]|nr:MAG: DUF2283 domain-containing protein [Gammaproteobacteria bacterium]
MKRYYDSQVDALYLELRTLQPGTATARDLTENVTANYAPDGKIAGIEILEVSSIADEDKRQSEDKWQKAVELVPA